MDINNCIKWHVDFSKLKNTVLYKDHLISMGIYGGFVAIDTNLIAVDEKYSKQLNSDLYTNIAVRNDTLFSEKFNQIYYLDDNSMEWISYQLNEPIALFEILYEDDKYVFFPICHGEFGSMLFIYDKKIKKLRAIGMSEEPQCVYFQNDEYYIIASLSHGFGSSTYFKVENINNINMLSKDNKILKHFQQLPVTEYPKLNQPPSSEKEVLNLIIEPEYGIKVFSTFLLDKKRFFLTGYNTFGSNYCCKPYITEIVENEIVVVDSIEHYKGQTKIYKNHTIIGSYNIAYEDRLYSIGFNGSPDYKYDYKINKFFFDNTPIPVDVFEAKLTDSTMNLKKIEYKLDSAISLIWIKKKDKFMFFMKREKSYYKLLLNINGGFIKKAFNYQGKSYLFFYSDENKYGLLEIYDLNRFIDEYCEKE